MHQIFGFYVQYMTLSHLFESSNVESVELVEVR